MVAVLHRAVGGALIMTDTLREATVTDETNLWRKDTVATIKSCRRQTSLMLLRFFIILFTK